MAKLNIKKDDTVIVLSGDNKGNTGKVIATSPKEGKLIVEGVNIIHKHVKPRRQGEAGGIIDAEGAIYASKVALVCSNAKCANNGKATRVKKVVEIKEDKDGNKTKKVTRVCAKCGKEI